VFTNPSGKVHPPHPPHPPHPTHGPHAVAAANATFKGDHLTDA
jgi:hypothetical protein